jgi:DNA-directed RNA polymerase specialized sigma subunit
MNTAATIAATQPISAAEREKRILDNLDLPKLTYRRIAESDMARREKDDLISEGNLALCLAANNWSPGKAAFRTYASRCIEKKMLAYLKKNLRIKTSLFRFLNYWKPKMAGRVSHESVQGRKQNPH